MITTEQFNELLELSRKITEQRDKAMEMAAKQSKMIDGLILEKEKMTKAINHIADRVRTLLIQIDKVDHSGGDSGGYHFAKDELLSVAKILGV